MDRINEIPIHKCDFHTGVKIKLNIVKRWHQQILDSLKEGGHFASKASGNSIVFGYKNQDGEIIIREVTNGYKSYKYHFNK